MLVHGSINLLNNNQTVTKQLPAVRKVVVIHQNEKALTPITISNKPETKMITINTANLFVSKPSSGMASSSSLDSSPRVLSQPETPTTIRISPNATVTPSYQPKVTTFVPPPIQKTDTQDINSLHVMRNWADPYASQYVYQSLMAQQSMQQQVISNSYQYQQSSQNSGWAFQYSAYNYLPNNGYYYQYQQYPQVPLPSKPKKDVNYSIERSSRNKQPARKVKAIPVPQLVTVDVKTCDKPLDKIPHFPYPNRNYVERPEPIQFMDTCGNVHNLTCTCKSQANEGTLIECRMCHNFMHLTCVNIAKEDDKHPFVCPFCMRKRIDCSCNENLNYSIPLIQCTGCGLWVHKACEGLSFGRLPTDFKCKKCGSGKYSLPLPKIDDSKNIRTSAGCDTFELISAVPDGNFRQSLVEDLNSSELDFANFIGKYVNQYIDLFMSGNTEFWNVFIDVAVHLFQVDADYINEMIDSAVFSMLYGPQKIFEYSFTPFTFSESISEFIESLSVTEYDSPKQEVGIYVDQIDGYVKSPKSLNENDFICDLPGFIVHTDEVDADEGIPPNVVNIQDTDVVVGLKGKDAELVSKIKRSLRPNCVAKFYKVKDQLKVGLFAARISSPIEDRPPRDGIIKSHGELRLLLDGELPFPTPKIQWREKKVRKSKDSKSKKQKSSEISTSSLSLLSSFLDDEVPSIPITLTVSKEATEKRKQYLNCM